MKGRAIEREGLILLTGGVAGGRAFDPDNPVEVALRSAFEDRIDDDDFAAELWSALTNTIWTAPDGTAYLLSFRFAGDVIAALRRTGDYLEWYCCGPAGRVSALIASVMEEFGWTHSIEPNPLDRCFGGAGPA